MIVPGAAVFAKDGADAEPGIQAGAEQNLTAQEVIEELSKLEVESLKLEDKEKVEGIRKAYDALPEGEKVTVNKEEVNNLGKLEKLEAKIKELVDADEAAKKEKEEKEKAEKEKAEKEKAEKEASEKRVAEVSKKINAIGEVTLEKEAAINEAKEAFEALNEEERKAIPYEDVAKLTAAKVELETLKKAAADKKAQEDKEKAEKEKEEKAKKDLENLKKTAVAEYKAHIGFASGARNGNIFIDLAAPKAGFNASVTVKDSRNKILGSAENLTTGKQIEVDYLAKGSKYYVEVVFKYGNETVETFTKELTSPVAEAPTLNYAYTFDGGLIISVDAQAGIQDIYWAYKDSRDFVRIPSDGGYGRNYNYQGDKDNKDKNDFTNLFEGQRLELDRYTRFDKSEYRIDLDIPSTVRIVLIDREGNKTPMQIKVDKDNVPLTNTVPDKIVRALRDTNEFRFKDSEKYQDLIVVEKNTTVDLFQAFEKHIVKGLKKFNTRDLEWKFSNYKDDTIPWTGVYKFKEAGVYRISVTDIRSGNVVEMAVAVNEGRNNVRSYKIENNKTVKVKKGTFKPSDAVEWNLYNNSEKPNPIRMIAVINGKYVSMNDEISMKDKDGNLMKEVKVQIIDLKENKTFDVKFVPGEEIKKEEKKEESLTQTTTTSFSDISGHWAESKIRALASKGIVKGYTDGTFKPGNMISIKEAMAIMGRLGMQKESLTGAVLQQGDLVSTGWGVEEVNFAFKRLPENIFAGKNLDTDPIKREEMAYVLKYLFNVNGGSIDLTLSDTDTSRFANEIKALIRVGSIKGMDDGSFKPELSITRAEMVSMLYGLPNGIAY